MATQRGPVEHFRTCPTLSERVDNYNSSTRVPMMKSTAQNSMSRTTQEREAKIQELQRKRERLFTHLMRLDALKWRFLRLRKEYLHDYARRTNRPSPDRYPYAIKNWVDPRKKELPSSTELQFEFHLGELVRHPGAFPKPLPSERFYCIDLALPLRAQLLHLGMLASAERASLIKRNSKFKAVRVRGFGEQENERSDEAAKERALLSNYYEILRWDLMQSSKSR